MSFTAFFIGFVRLLVVSVAVAIAGATAVNAQQTATYEVVSSFGLTFGAGRAPSSLRQNSDGTFYGATSSSEAPKTSSACPLWRAMIRTAPPPAGSIRHC